MKIRNKILVYFSSTVIVLSALSLVVVFVLFSEYREEEFQQQQFAKIKYTIGLVDEFDEMSAEVSRLLDKQDIHDFYDEKLLIFDQNKKLLFSSIDSLDILKSEAILHQLSVSNDWIETKEDGYDLIGVYVENNANGYYAISKAYDFFGYSKKDFLQKILVGIFVAVVVIVLLISLYLSNIISKPITDLTDKIADFDLGNSESELLEVKTTTSELQELSEKFNQLYKRTNEAFLFQKYSIQHISHQLKTPISVLVSELERLDKEKNVTKIQAVVSAQAKKAKSLGNIINVLLQMAKIESGQDVVKTKVRIDDLIFDCMSEISLLYPKFNLSVYFLPNNFDENKLNVLVDPALIQQAFLNLLINAAEYSDNNKAAITFDCDAEYLKIIISNTGKVLSEDEQRFLFSHFFRGENAQDKQGFGIGLILSKQIFEIHQARISYVSVDERENNFIVNFHQY